MALSFSCRVPSNTVTEAVSCRASGNVMTALLTSLRCSFFSLPFDVFLACRCTHQRSGATLRGISIAFTFSRAGSYCSPCLQTHAFSSLASAMRVKLRSVPGYTHCQLSFCCSASLKLMLQLDTLLRGEAMALCLSAPGCSINSRIQRSLELSTKIREGCASPVQASPEAICNSGCRYLSRAAGLNLFLPYMHFCGLAKARSISVIHNHYSHLCRVAEGLSDHQALARLSTAASSGRLLRPSRLLSIGSAALVAGSTLSKVVIIASLLLCTFQPAPVSHIPNIVLCVHYAWPCQIQCNDAWRK